MFGKERDCKMSRRLFGTDGIRGVANNYPLTPEMLTKIGRAIAHYFKERNNKPKHKIVIGKDTRLSGYMVEYALTSAICSAGVDVLLVGPMPTPAIAHLTRSFNCDAGIVLSASHNPAQDNGIKIFDENGFKLPDEVEEEIEGYVFSEEINHEHIRGELVGKASRIDDARGRYIEFAKSSIKSASLHGLKIVLDCANGAAYNIAPVILSELGAEVIVLNNKPDGLNINKECGAVHPEVIQQKVREIGADVGIAVDGDADRAVFCDEYGNLVDGDKIMVMITLHFMEKGLLNHNALVITDYSNLGVDKAVNAAGGKVIRARNGDRYVAEEMRKNNYTIGGEKSGHIIFGRYSTTGDGVITALQVLNLMKETGRKMSELAGCVDEMPQVLVNVDVREKKQFEEMPGFFAKLSEVSNKIKGRGRLIARYSGTQNVCRIMIEGETKGEIEGYANELAEELRREAGV
jgi:phosphoglucosamine mutase